MKIPNFRFIYQDVLTMPSTSLAHMCAAEKVDRTFLYSVMKAEAIDEILRVDVAVIGAEEVVWIVVDT